MIVDSDILIDLSRNYSIAVEKIAAFERTSILLISSMTVMEMVVGCRNKAELKETKGFLKRFEVLHFTDQISELASDLVSLYNLSHGLLIPDAIIAATAIVFDEELISKNQRDFRFIDGLKLLSYP